MNPRSTDYNVDALTTAPSRRFDIFDIVLTIKKMKNLVVGLFDDLVASFCSFICDINIFACAVSL